VNHNEDIDDGIAEFQAERERAEAEKVYRRFANLFDSEINGKRFTGKKVGSIVLAGRRTGHRGHPYDFENGTITLDGQHGGTPATLTVRWANDLGIVDTSLSVR